MIRSNSYDTLAYNLQRLGSIAVRENIILKSEDSGKFEKVAPIHKESQALCQILADQFNSLRRDWVKAVIQKSRYVDNLKTFADFIEGHPGVNLPEEITLEVTKYF